MAKKQDLIAGKRITVYIDGDQFFAGRTFVVHPRTTRKFEALLTTLTDFLDPKFGAVRHLRSVDGSIEITSLNELVSGASYVAYGQRFHPFQYTEISNKPKPLISTLTSPREQKRLIVSGRARKIVRHPVIVYVYANGEPLRPAKKILLQPWIHKTWDNVLGQISSKVPLRTGAIRQLIDLNTKTEVAFGADLQDQQFYVAVGMERFKDFEYGLSPSMFTPKQQMTRRYPTLPPIEPGDKVSKESTSLSAPSGSKKKLSPKPPRSRKAFQDHETQQESFRTQRKSVERSPWPEIKESEEQPPQAEDGVNNEELKTSSKKRDVQKNDEKIISMGSRPSSMKAEDKQLTSAQEKEPSSQGHSDEEDEGNSDFKTSNKEDNSVAIEEQVSAEDPVKKEILSHSQDDPENPMKPTSGDEADKVDSSLSEHPRSPPKTEKSWSDSQDMNERSQPDGDKQTDQEKETQDNQAHVSESPAEGDNTEVESGEMGKSPTEGDIAAIEKEQDSKSAIESDNTAVKDDPQSKSPTEEDKAAVEGDEVSKSPTEEDNAAVKSGGASKSPTEGDKAAVEGDNSVIENNNMKNSTDGEHNSTAVVKGVVEDSDKDKGEHDGPGVTSGTDLSNPVPQASHPDGGKNLPEEINTEIAKEPDSSNGGTEEQMRPDAELVLREDDKSVDPKDQGDHQIIDPKEENDGDNTVVSAAPVESQG